MRPVVLALPLLSLLLAGCPESSPDATQPASGSVGEVHLRPVAHDPPPAAQGPAITTVAGSGTGAWGRFSGDGGPATEARLASPESVAFDAAGNLYIADHDNARIRKVDRSGTITTVAGGGNSGSLGDGGSATRATLSWPKSVAVDAAGNLYIADARDSRIRKVDPSGTITTIAGGESPGVRDGRPATEGAIGFPVGVAVDAAGNLFIADNGGHRIRKVDPSGTITTIAGSGTRGFSGDGGPATEAQIASPQAVAVDAAGNLFITDGGNHRIRKVASSGIITTIAGGVTGSFSGDGGPATEAQLNHPGSIAIDAAGNLYIADSHNGRIRKIDPSGIITTIAGSGGAETFTGDEGPATSVALYLPKGVAVDAAGNVFIADSGNHRIRKVSANGK